MKKLDYGTLLSSKPIKLSIGSLRKPKLYEIAALSFEKFNLFQSFLKLTPEFYYTKIVEDGERIWDQMPEDIKYNMTLFSVIQSEQSLQQLYVDIFNFFFEENVLFLDGMFILFDVDTDKSPEKICGIIDENLFPEVLCIIQQICCIYDENQQEQKVFKNEATRKDYEKMQKDRREWDKQKEKVRNANLSIPNIISALSNMHPTLNPINVWNLTLFQLLDSFNRVRANLIYNIDSTRVSVWGDEKKTFDLELWYKNNFE